MKLQLNIIFDINQSEKESRNTLYVDLFVRFVDFRP